MAKNVPVVIFGAGGHALVVAEILQMMGHSIAGFIDDTDPLRKAQAFGPAKVLGGSDVLHDLQSDGLQHAIVAIGHCGARTRIAENLEAIGFTLVTAIHPTASVSRDAEVAPGCVVSAQAAVNIGVRLERNVIVNTGATVDHECRIGPGVHIGPGVNLAGKVTVGSGTWIGIGATVLDRISIGEGAYIGAGSLVLKNIPSGMLAYGVPAQIIREVSK